MKPIRHMAELDQWWRVISRAAPRSSMPIEARDGDERYRPGATIMMPSSRSRSVSSWASASGGGRDGTVEPLETSIWPRPA